MECYCDEELLYLMRCGNETAQKCLYERYRSYLKNWASRHIGQLNSVFGWDDLLQEGMCILGSAFETFRSDKQTSLKTYTQLVTTRRIINYMSRKSTKKASSDVEIVSLDQFYNQEGGLRNDEVMTSQIGYYSPLTYMTVKEESKAYKKILDDSLSLHERTVMSYIHKGYSQEEVSQKMNIPLKSVYNAIYRYNQKMKVID